MDHEVVVRQQMTERYLLDELDPYERAEFEEHFFECRLCALDVQAGALFVVQSRVALAEEPISGGLPVPTTVPVTSGSFAWLRPTNLQISSTRRDRCRGKQGDWRGLIRIANSEVSSKEELTIWPQIRNHLLYQAPAWNRTTTTTPRHTCLVAS